MFGIANIPAHLHHPIHDVEFTGIRGPHGGIPIRVIYPSSAPKGSKDAAALIYFHGGGYTVGSVDEFENGLRLLAEASGVQIYAADYRLAPEWRYPVQLDEYSAIIDALHGEFGNSRGVSPKKIFGGGDSAGGNMTAAITLKRRDEGKKPLAGQFLLYPEARIPFDTPAGTENNTGLYLECNGIFSFADHYLPRGVSPAFKYISPGMQSLEYLGEGGQPPARVFTSGFDPLRGRSKLSNTNCTTAVSMRQSPYGKPFLMHLFFLSPNPRSPLSKVEAHFRVRHGGLHEAISTLPSLRVFALPSSLARTRRLVILSYGGLRDSQHYGGPSLLHLSCIFRSRNRLSSYLSHTSDCATANSTRSH